MAEGSCEEKQPLEAQVKFRIMLHRRNRHGRNCRGKAQQQGTNLCPGTAAKGLRTKKNRNRTESCSSIYGTCDHITWETHAVTVTSFRIISYSYRAGHESGRFDDSPILSYSLVAFSNGCLPLEKSSRESIGQGWPELRQGKAGAIQFAPNPRSMGSFRLQV